MKKISIYRPTSIEEAIQVLSLHGTEAGVYAGGTDLLRVLRSTFVAVLTKTGGRTPKDSLLPW